MVVSLPLKDDSNHNLTYVVGYYRLMKGNLMNLPLGTRVNEKCPNCKENVTGIVTKKVVASFFCNKCKNEWKLNLVESKGKGSRFTEESLKNLLERNRNVKIK